MTRLPSAGTRQARGPPLALRLSDGPIHRALCSLGSAIAVAAAACRRQADGDDPEDPTDERYAVARPGYALAPLKARSI